MKQYFFSQETYQSRRRDLVQAVGNGVIIFPSNEEVGINYRDNTYPFRQDSSFLYYCGIDRAGLFLLIDCNTGKSSLVGNELTVEDIVWTGPMASLSELANHAGIDQTISEEVGKEFIQKQTAQKTHIHYLPIYRGDHAFRLGSFLGKSPLEISSNYSVSLCHATVTQREIKTTEEIDQLGQAINISGDMHIAMMKFAKAGMKESEVMAKVRSICLQQDVDIPYTIILSVNGQTLHNHSYQNILQPGQLLLGDFGSESTMHYAGDITRTIPVNKTFSGLQKDIYEIVLDALNISISGIKAGIQYKTIHLNAARSIANGLKDLGFLKGDTEEIVATGAHTLFFPHGLGHPLGLDVHDMEGIGEQYTGYEPGLERSKEFGLKSLRLAKTLRKGMVLTVEPGIYFIPELISIWKKEHKYSSFMNYDKIEKTIPFGGIRLEDNVLVLPDSAQILGKPIPKNILDVEALRMEAYT